MKRCLYVLTMTILPVLAYCQIKPDKAKPSGMAYMQEALGLSPQQAAKIKQITAEHASDMRQVSQTGTDTLQRKALLESKHRAYRNQIRDILSKKQWGEYLLIEGKRNRAVIEEARKKNIRVMPGRILN